MPAMAMPVQAQEEVQISEIASQPGLATMMLSRMLLYHYPIELELICQQWLCQFKRKKKSKSVK